jgi:hypothetical protein
MSQKHKITVKDYEWECGEGCCTEMGREFYIDGVMVFRGSCEEHGWMTVLEKLGIDAELEGLNERGELVWKL